ncbi:MAG: S66 peptidase family protein [Lachnotalea sp.]
MLIFSRIWLELYDLCGMKSNEEGTRGRYTRNKLERSKKEEKGIRIMIKVKSLKKGDRVAIVSLSSGMLGEEFCSHNIEIGIKRLKEYGLEPVFMTNTRKGISYLRQHPEARASDLKQAFMDDSIKGIICAIGGDDTYRLLPYLLEDKEFIQAVKKHPKLFTGFSDTTINHLMFYQLGLMTYYGPNFICDLGEIATNMLPYTEKAFRMYLGSAECREIVSSPVWYEERIDFSRAAIGTERIVHRENRGFELLQGAYVFEGGLLGGCLESLYDILTSTRYEDEKEVCETYHLFPSLDEWKGKILFIETCEEKPTPAMLREELLSLKAKGIFDVVNGILIGKPQDEMYYEEYKSVFTDVIDNKELPILYNVNFGHAIPRCVIPYGIHVKVDAFKKKIIFLEDIFG